MRENRFAQLLASGRTLLGAHLPFPSPELVEYCGLLGFDWVFIDAEHGVVGVEKAQDLVRAADAVGIASLVRVPTTAAWVVLSYVESGADVVLAPHVATPQIAVELVSAVRYWPEGSRGAGSTTRAANWGLTQSPAEYFGAHDRHALPMAMLEDASAFDRIPELSAVPGLDLFFIGAGDLAMSMGLPGQAAHPDVMERVYEAARVLTGQGKHVGAMAGTPEAVKAWAELGCRILAVSAGPLLASAATKYLAESRQLLGAPSTN